MHCNWLAQKDICHESGIGDRSLVRGRPRESAHTAASDGKTDLRFNLRVSVSSRVGASILQRQSEHRNREIWNRISLGVVGDGRNLDSATDQAPWRRGLKTR